MAEMSRVFQFFCRSAPWRVFAGTVVLPWALQQGELDGDVLEIGCGSGAMAAVVLERFPNVRLTATDYDATMVTAARERLAPFGSRADVRPADATALPFADDSFDVVLSFVMLHHVGHWEQALSEVKRVLRPGGRLVGYDLVGDGIGRFVNGHDRGTRLMRVDELHRTLADLHLDDAATRRSVGGLATRFSARKVD